MKTKKITIGAIAISALILIVVVTLFATSAKEQETAGNADDTKVLEKIEGPEVVVAAANEWVEQRFANSTYLDWRVESLEHVYTYEDFEGMTLQVYRMNYEYLVDNPEEIVLAGGMSIDEEGWLVPEYPNCTYLVFEQVGEELYYLTTFMENDCFPGDELFTKDLRDVLGYENVIETPGELVNRLVYIVEFDGAVLAFDEIEWITVPSERATELGVTEDDAPNGFYIYNEAAEIEELSITKDCECKLLAWTMNYVEMEVTVEGLVDILKEREGTSIPYLLTFEGNEIVAISEQYVP